MQRICHLVILIFLLAFFSCKKAKLLTGPGTPTENLFENTVINQNFIISLATDSTTDITSEYAGYTFKLLKTDYYHGPLEAKKDANTYSGSWSSNEDYSKLVITLPATPSPFIFLTRAWRFTKKDFEELDLAPWGSTAPVVLHMVKQ